MTKNKTKIIFAYIALSISGFVLAYIGYKIFDNKETINLENNLSFDYHARDSLTLSLSMSNEIISQIIFDSCHEAKYLYDVLNSSNISVIIGPNVCMSCFYSVSESINQNINGQIVYIVPNNFRRLVIAHLQSLGIPEPNVFTHSINIFDKFDTPILWLSNGFSFYVFIPSGTNSINNDKILRLYNKLSQ